MSPDNGLGIRFAVNSTYVHLGVPHVMRRIHRFGWVYVILAAVMDEITNPCGAEMEAGTIH